LFEAKRFRLLAIEVCMVCIHQNRPWAHAMSCFVGDRVRPSASGLFDEWLLKLY
jgi:hypothetical protein